MRKLRGISMCLPLLVASSLWAATPWEHGVEQIEAYLKTGLAAYHNGDSEGADRHFSDAYFVAYEASGLEIAVRQLISAKRNYELEKMFRNLRLLVHGEAEPSALEAQIEKLRAAVAEDVETLRSYRKEDFFAAEEVPRVGNAEGHANGPAAWGLGNLFVQSLLVILREGFEAILLIGALIAYLQRAGRRREIAVIYQAAAIAVVASLLTAYLFQKVLSLSAASQEVVEGFTMLLASAVLFYVSYWLISKTESRRWLGYVRGKVEKATESGSMTALGAVAFLAVYREGAETVLFYQALFAGLPGASRNIWGGFAAGCAVLLLLFLVVRKVVGKLPVAPFFAVTSGFLYYLAFVFAGKGVHELQEGGLVGDTPLSFVHHVEFLGIFPSLEGIVLQMLFVLALALVAVRWRWTKRTAVAASAS